MSWSKVSNKYNKPFKWWYCKLLCEWYYHIKNTDKYYHYLDSMMLMGYNLYGEKI